MEEMKRVPITAAFITNVMMHIWACSCPEEIQCTRQNCLIAHKTTSAKHLTAQRYDPCNIMCLYGVIAKANCSSIEDLKLVCRCRAGLYKLTGSNWTCVPHTLCPPGQGVKILGSSDTDTVCEKCETGKEFSSTNSSKDRCVPCAHCDNSSPIVAECSPTSDTVCRNSTDATTSNPKADFPSKNDLNHALGSEEKQMATIVIASNVAAIVTIVGVISIVMMVLYRKGKLHCLHRHGPDTETILRNEESNMIVDAHHPGLNELGESNDGSDVLQRRTANNNVSSDESVSVLYERHASSQHDRDSSSRTGISSSVKRIPRSSSLPQARGSAGRPDRNLPRNTYSFNEDMQLNRLQSGGQRKPVYPFQRALTDLSHHLCGIEWEMFFRRLIGEGSDEILGRVKRDHARSVREQIYHMLLE